MLTRLDVGLVLFAAYKVKAVLGDEYYLQTTSKPARGEDALIEVPDIMICTIECKVNPPKWYQNGLVLETGGPTLSMVELNITGKSGTPCSGPYNMLTILSLGNKTVNRNEYDKYEFFIVTGGSTSGYGDVVQASAQVLVVPNRNNPFALNNGVLPEGAIYPQDLVYNLYGVAQRDSTTWVRMTPTTTKLRESGIRGLFGFLQDQVKYSVTSSVSTYSKLLYTPDFIHDSNIVVNVPTETIEQKEIVINTIPNALGSWGGAFSVVWGLFYFLFGSPRMDPFGFFAIHVFGRKGKRRISRQFTTWGKPPQYDEERQGLRQSQDTLTDISLGESHPLQQSDSQHVPLQMQHMDQFSESETTQQQDRRHRMLLSRINDLEAVLREYYLNMDLFETPADANTGKDTINIDNKEAMAPANKAWIRSKMAAIKKASGIAFSEEIFLSILICLIAKNKHLVLHTYPELVPELKSIIEQASTSGAYYQYSNPADDFAQRNAKLRLEKSRRSVATNHSEASDYSLRPSEYNYNVAPSIASFKTASERDLDGVSIQRGGGGFHQQDVSEHSRGGDESTMGLRMSESRSKNAGDGMTEQILHHRSRRSTHISPPTVSDYTSVENMNESPSGGGGGNSNRRSNPHYVQTSATSSAYLGGGGGASISSGPAPVTPVDFTFPRRRHESVSNTGGYGGGGETSGITYSGRRIAQAIILDGLENASQEVYATLLEMIINKEINDRNRYVLPDLIIIAIFSSPKVPDNIPKQLLDYFAVNGAYYHSTVQSRIQPMPEWDEFSKRMKAVTVSNDMMRYIRDVIVGIRTHEAVHGGLTARAALDLEAIIKTLAAIFQATFVTPDLLMIAAEKVFSHRLQLKATRRQQILAAATSSSSLSSIPQVQSSSHPQANNDKVPMKGYQGYREQVPQHSQSGGHGRKNSTSSEQSSVGGASFVEFSDSEEGEGERRSTGAGHDQHKTDREQRFASQERMVQYQDAVEEEETAADVVRDVLKAVYPPI
ncbi:hypothetical protein BGZ51_006926 [Haplosporangium sp. Z 767]|nr:hypothetical protein BGZ51_006926 [Haplosporangium sp. Z 767]